MESVIIPVGSIERSLEGRANSIERHYWLARPKTTAARTPPLVVMLHGTGGSGAFAADETRLHSFAENAGFVLALPDALPVDRNRPAAFLSNPQRWNDGSTEAGDPLHHEHDDVAFLNAVVGDAITRGPADSRNVFVTGFSNGAAMTFRFASEKSELVAAIAPVAGYCPLRFTSPCIPPPTLYLIGDVDPLVPLRGGPVVLPWTKQAVMRRSVDEMLATWADATGCHPHPITLDHNHGVREEIYPTNNAEAPAFRRVVIEGLGHHWPGGKGQFNPRLGGPPSNRLDANERIWTFFREHHRS